MNKQFLVLYIPEDDYAGVLPLPGELLSPPVPPRAVGLLVLLGAHGEGSALGLLPRVRVLLHAAGSWSPWSPSMP